MFFRRTLPLLFAACTIATAAVLASPVPVVPKVAATSEKPKSAATATPSSAGATPAPAKKPSFFKRIFGGGAKRPAATPSATPAATPVHHRGTVHKAVNDENSDDNKPEKTEKPEAAGDEKKPEKTGSPEAGEAKPEAHSGPASTPSPSGKKGGKKGGAATPPPKVLTKEQAAVQKAVASGDAEAVEKAKYDEVKSRAMADQHVKELHEKADEATTDEDGRKALHAYNKALFQKMRSLDPSLQARVDRMEEAVLKEIDKGP